MSSIGEAGPLERNKAALERAKLRIEGFEQVSREFRSREIWAQAVNEGEIGEVEEIPLTLREIEVLQLVADGEMNGQIAIHLGLASETVKSHLRHITSKLGALGRANAVAEGFRRGYLS